MLWLTYFFNSVIQDYNYFPDDWKEFNTCFIQKGNGGFRPITLACTLLKIWKGLLTIDFNGGVCSKPHQRGSSPIFLVVRMKGLESEVCK